MPQTAEEIREEKEQTDSDFLQTAIKCCCEEIKAADEIEKEKKRNLFIDAVNENKGMIVNNRISVDDWYVEDEFDNKNVKMSDNVKFYLNDLIKNTIVNKK